MDNQENIKTTEESIKSGQENIKTTEESIKLAQEDIKRSEEIIKVSQEDTKIAKENVELEPSTQNIQEKITTLDAKNTSVTKENLDTTTQASTTQASTTQASTTQAPTTQAPVDKKPEYPVKKFFSWQKKINMLFQENDEIDYKRVDVLVSFLNSKGKIIPARYTRLSYKKQRKLSRAIKRARQAGLLPFTYNKRG